MTKTKADVQTSHNFGNALLPTWAVVSVILLVTLGVLLYATKESREASGLFSALNQAQLTVDPSEDGASRTFGQVVLTTGRKELPEMLGKCRTKPRWALEIFRKLIAEGAKEGRILACRVAYSLIQEGRLSAEERDAVFKDLVAQTQGDRAAELRRVAQYWLSELIAIEAVEKKEQFQKLPERAKKENKEAKKEEKDEKNTGDGKAEKEGRVELTEMDAPDGKILVVQWSDPATLQAWWTQFGSSAKWNEKLSRYIISQP